MDVDFSTNGSPKSVADAIEALARAQGSVAALVVPWESTASTLSMAVTSVKIDGWAIEHTNLGTIRLTAEGDTTRVAVIAQTRDDEGEARLGKVFGQFARDLQQKLAKPVGDPSR